MRLIKLPAGLRVHESSKALPADFDIEIVELIRPPDHYCILSHTWADEEISFADVTQQRSYKQLKGWRKLSMTITQGSEDGFEYLWVDTCCIDKSSSAELSEAINSMWQWYAKASVCYVYLDDVDFSDRKEEDLVVKTRDEQFVSARWFTRGWTLQELLAPRHICFFDQSWRLIGDKIALYHSIAATTGIEVQYLANPDRIQRASVSRRMSWAAWRNTSRDEDMAYCLLGIFDINMPMLYGEGMKAFLRLQRHILEQYDDHTLFAWRQLPDSPYKSSGLLASHPSDFYGSSDFLPKPGSVKSATRMTNQGLQIVLTLSRASVDPSTFERPDESSLTYMARLDCSPSVSLVLSKMSARSQVYMRRDLQRSPRRPVHAEADTEILVRSDGHGETREHCESWRLLQLCWTTSSQADCSALELHCYRAHHDGNLNIRAHQPGQARWSPLIELAEEYSSCICVLFGLGARPNSSMQHREYVVLIVDTYADDWYCCAIPCSNVSDFKWRCASTLGDAFKDVRRHLALEKVESVTKLAWSSRRGGLLVQKAFEPGSEHIATGLRINFVSAANWLDDGSVPDALRKEEVVWAMKQNIQLEGCSSMAGVLRAMPKK